MPTPALLELATVLGIGRLSTMDQPGIVGRLTREAHLGCRRRTVPVRNGPWISTIAVGARYTARHPGRIAGFIGELRYRA